MVFKIARRSAAHDMYIAIGNVLPMVTMSYNVINDNPEVAWEVSYDERLTHITTGVRYYTSDIYSVIDEIGKDTLLIIINNAMLRAVDSMSPITRARIVTLNSLVVYGVLSDERLELDVARFPEGYSSLLERVSDV